MVRTRGPLFSLTARGWFGHITYKHQGVVVNPYPFALLGKITIPYSLWDRNIHGFYRIPAFGLRPYPSFISMYYSHLGWCYQRRRTWHGVTWTAIKPPIAHHPYSIPWAINKDRIRRAVLGWQALMENEKKVYNQYSYPKHCSGYNKYIRWYMKNN